MNSTDYFERFLVSLLAGVLSFLIGYYMSKNVKKPKSGVKYDNKLKYLSEGTSQMFYYRMKGLMYSSVFFIIMAMVYLILSFIEFIR